MTKLARAQTFPVFTPRLPQQETCLTTSGWIEFGDAEDGTYPDWYLDGNALRVQTSKSDPSKGQSTSYHTFLTQNNPYFLTDDQGETSRISPVPDYVFCSIVVSVRKCADQTGVSPKKKFLYPDSLQIRWQDSAEHDRLRRVTDHFVRHRGPDGKREYLSTSRVRVLEHTSDGFKEVDSCTFETSAQWNRVLPQMVARFCSSGQWTPFLLELNTEYEWFVVAGDLQLPDGIFYRHIQDTLGKNAHKNFDNKHYWSKKLLKRLFDRDTIRKLLTEYAERSPHARINSQQPGCLSAADRDNFESWLERDRIRLLAVIIYIDADLDCLYKLMKKIDNGDAEDVKDSDIPLSDDVYESFLESRHHLSFHYTQAGFRPVDFPEPMKVMYVQDGDRLPIYFDKNQPLGNGGTSEVFEATIHSDYHAFSPNKNQVFALKRLKFAVEKAQNEVKVWQRFAKVPHPHINSFYTCWTQSDRFYMLSPLAELNLEEFLNKSEPPDRLRDTEGILEQLEGIASAIHHIHHVGRAGYSSSKIANDKIDYGYHHDLKPANILIFGLKHWKITDFGTARIRQVQSGSPPTNNLYTYNLPDGDEEYGGPDHYTNEIGRRRVGSPYDIWSFGCIMLEVLLWTFGKTGDDRTKFMWERYNNKLDKLNICKCEKQSCRKDSSSDSDCGIESNTSFWYQCRKANQCHVKPCVLEKLEWIKQQIEATYPMLEPLYKLVKKMLRVSAKDRPAASVVLSDLGGLRVRAGLFFARQHRKSANDGRYTDENADIDTQTGYESYAISSRMSSPTTEATPSGQPSQRSSQKRRRNSSTHSNKDLSPMPPGANIIHAGDHLRSQNSLPEGSSYLEVPGEKRPFLKKRRGDHHADVKTKPHDTDTNSRIFTPLSAPELDYNVAQNAENHSLPDREQSAHSGRPNQPPSDPTRNTTWINKQMAKP